LAKVLKEIMTAVPGRFSRLFVVRHLVQLVGRAEDDERDLAVAQHAQLVGLLHHTELALVERHLKRESNTFWKVLTQSGLPDFSWSKLTKTGKICQMTTIYTKRP
jgi:hypothetical protein